MDFRPNTSADREAMQAYLGIESIEELFADIPGELRLRGRPDLPAPLAESVLVAHMRRLAARNLAADDYVCFAGGGAYDHLIPAAVGHLLGRSEFYTAYTPYQAEVSQGLLQAIYEYQTLICQLTAMDVGNASMYDGATALAEAAIMACGATGRRKVFVAPTIHPAHRAVISTYLKSRDFEACLLPWGEDGRVDAARCKERARREGFLGEAAGVLVQHPNFLGILEPVEALADLAHSRGALLVASVSPISLGLLRPPGEYGADIAVGEGQPLGNHLSFGGPYLGFFACRDELKRRLPGRVVGATLDNRGRRGFVLTLQTREQHIRRERATSNICSNQALSALAAAIHLCLLGKNGFRQVAEQCLYKAHYAQERIEKLPGYRLKFPSPFFHEFALETPLPADTLVARLMERRILPGLPLGRFLAEAPASVDPPAAADTATAADQRSCGRSWEKSLLVCVTEARTRDEIDRLVEALGEEAAGPSEAARNGPAHQSRA